MNDLYVWKDPKGETGETQNLKVVLNRYLTLLNIDRFSKKFNVTINDY